LAAEQHRLGGELVVLGFVSECLVPVVFVLSPSLQGVHLSGARPLSGAVYTQYTDVENEVNGLVTYDRSTLKIPQEYLKELNNALIENSASSK